MDGWMVEWMDGFMVVGRVGGFLDGWMEDGWIRFSLYNVVCLSFQVLYIVESIVMRILQLKSSSHNHRLRVVMMSMMTQTQ